MDENPSSPEDGLEGALRRALSDAVGGIEPGAEGLEEIRARTDRRPPRPWLLAVLSGVVERVKFWTWRGHWAWPGRPRARAHLPRLARRPPHHQGIPTEKPRRRGDTFSLPGPLGTWRIGAFWLATGLAGIAVIASVSLGVQPVRRVIMQAGTVLDLGGAPSQHGAGTNGAGAQTTTDGTGPLADGGATAAARPSPTSAPGSTAGPGGAAPGPESTARCQPSASGSTATPDPSATSASICTVTPAIAASTQPGVTGALSTPAGTVPTDTTPADTVPTDPTATDTAPADPTPTDTTPTDTTPTDPTPTVTTPTDTTPTDTTPTDTTPTDTPTTTPADTPTSTATDTPTSTAADTPAGPGSAPDTAAGPPSTDQGHSPAGPAESGSWRWYAQLRLWYDELYRAGR